MYFLYPKHMPSVASQVVYTVRPPHPCYYSTLSYTLSYRQPGRASELHECGERVKGADGPRQTCGRGAERASMGTTMATTSGLPASTQVTAAPLSGCHVSAKLSSLCH
ncbi:hypothetical protein CY34DRAFT_397429 [Suillus luteus UH-Slu-Lm8-n1]|uniref:Uncharacterized protein n=1 Tax=Suillus luteus UH-Slu-Lm8-n1 TaxID=930992 RepID=A0A0D0AVD0_9AGAM|nr:hypothetical protein CY34DRAFT_397429 [Suillus luteus UH-Slu-Lm8-n1]